MRIAIDIDGCLANFNLGYLRLLKQLSGLDIKVDESTWPSEWNWAALLLPQGITKYHEVEAWDLIESGDSEFWASLEPYDGVYTAATLYQQLNAYHDVYFVTSRPGYRAKHQTEKWLSMHGFGPNPTVLISHKKGFAAAGLELDHLIDDKPENLFDVRKIMGLSCKGWLVQRPWNQGADTRFVFTTYGVADALTRILTPEENKNVN